jgi:Tol biopolymer transport system component
MSRNPSAFDRTVLATIAIVLALTGLLIWRGDQTGSAAPGALLSAAAAERGTAAASAEGAAAAAQAPAAGLAATPHVLFTTVLDGVEQLFAVPWQEAPNAGNTALAAPQLLTGGGGSVWDYAPSPDGSRIVYSALNDEGGSDLWQTEIAGSAPSLLLACPQGFCANPAWSPDGRLLAYSMRNANDFAAAAVSPPRLFLMDTATQEIAPVFADSQKLGFEPRWSADGQWLAYLAPDFFGVTAYNVETGDEQFYATQTGETAAWHPQRTEFLMTEQAQISGTHVVHLYLVDPIGNTRRNLSGAQSLVEDGSPAWSPDGEWIAFRRTELSGPNKTLSKQLWLLRIGGEGEVAEARALTADPEHDYGAPAWSDDGGTLLYHRFPLKGPNIVISVWAMHLVGGEQVEIARPGQRPQWSN